MTFTQKNGRLYSTNESSASDSDEWSLLTTKEDDVLSCASSMTEDELQSSSHSLASLSGNNKDDNTEYNSDLYLDELYYRRQPRHGKKQLKHSLVKRSAYFLYSFGWSCQDDHIVVMSRPVDDKGYSDKTAVDELLPELLLGSPAPVAMLGRRNRWQAVKTILDRLVDEGVAKCFVVEKGSTFGPRFGHNSDAPHDIVRYVVQPNGDKFKDNKHYTYFTHCVHWKHEVSQGIHYVLYTAKKDQDDGTRRRYSCKKKNWPKDYDDYHHNRSYKRAEPKKDIDDALRY